MSRVVDDLVRSKIERVGKIREVDRVEALSYCTMANSGEGWGMSDRTGRMTLGLETLKKGDLTVYEPWLRAPKRTR